MISLGFKRFFAAFRMTDFSKFQIFNKHYTVLFVHIADILLGFDGELNPCRFEAAFNRRLSHRDFQYFFIVHNVTKKTGTLLMKCPHNLNLIKCLMLVADFHLSLCEFFKGLKVTGCCLFGH